MAVVGWVDTENILEFWPDAPDDEEVLSTYLTAAWEQCVAYLPPESLVPYPDPVPRRWVLAQVGQARALMRSNVAGSGDQIGGEVTVTVFPMDWTIKNLLRPKKIGRVL